MRTLSIVLGLMLSPFQLAGQGSAGTTGGMEPRWVVDVPTAGILPGRSYALDIDFYNDGGVLLWGTIGILDRLNLGISFGGTNLIGKETPEMNPLPGVNVKIRVLDESLVLPAVALGFDSQGRGAYVDSTNRYAVKSPGVFLVASKNYDLLGFLSIHGGVNYSFERGDGDTDINVFLGVEKTLGPVISFLLEYNLATNDSDTGARGKGRGYLNAMVNWSVGGGFTLGIAFRDLISNGEDVRIGDRAVRLEFSRFF